MYTSPRERTKKEEEEKKSNQPWSSNTAHKNIIVNDGTALRNVTNLLIHTKQNPKTKKKEYTIIATNKIQRVVCSSILK
jgi:transcriptional regulator of NAD metabolism